MKLKVIKRNERYELSLMPVTQLIGNNIPMKTFVLDSLCKHFSSDKYKEYEELYIDNILLDGEIPGRKQWESYRISGREDIISMLQIGKTGIVTKCIKQYIDGFECQNELLQIDWILLHIFEELNKAILGEESVELSYTQESLFSMIQKTDIKTKDGFDIHVLDTDDLFDVFFDTVEKLQTIIPEKRLYVFENIDHMVSVNQYHILMERCKVLSEEKNIWFIFSSSIGGYIHLDEDIFSGINVFNEEIFIFPEYERFHIFIKDNYPIERKWEKQDILESLEKIAHLISCSNAVPQPKDEILLKMINESLGLKSCWTESLKVPEMNYLLT